MTHIMKASAARSQWHQLLNKVYNADDRVVLEKSGIRVAALISIRDLERYKRLEEEREERFKALDQSWDAFKDVLVDEIERETAAAVQQMRQRRRKQE